MENGSLATELLHSLKSSCKRLFIAFIIVLVMLFVTNIAWLYAWNLPSEEVTTTVTQDSGDDGDNNYIGNDGDINGETDSQEKSN